MHLRSLTFALSLALAVVAVNRQSLAQERTQRGYDTPALFQAVGNLYAIDPDLLAAIASVESANSPTAISPKGAQGLMQLMPETARRFAVNDSFDPVDNLLGAARFIDQIRDVLAPTLPELLAAYNAGERAVLTYRGVPPYPETEEYVRRVLLTYLLGKPATRPMIGAAQTQARPTVAAHNQLDALDRLAEIRSQRAAAMRQPPDPCSSSR